MSGRNPGSGSGTASISQNSQARQSPGQKSDLPGRGLQSLRYLSHRVSTRSQNCGKIQFPWIMLPPHRTREQPSLWNCCKLPWIKKDSANRTANWDLRMLLRCQQKDVIPNSWQQLWSPNKRSTNCASSELAPVWLKTVEKESGDYVGHRPVSYR